MDAPDRVTKRIEHWKTQLLDLSRRNRLLFFKEGAGSIARLAEPPAQEIFARLVARRERLEFYARDDEGSLLDESEGEAEGTRPAIETPLRPNEVRHDLPAKQAWRRLYTLRLRSRTSVEEQGVVTLFVAFGLLRWRETPTSNEEVASPLVLVPVELTQRSGRDNFRLGMLDEEIALNPTLCHVMRSQFGIELPPVPDVEELDRSVYFEAVRSAVASQQRWRVDDTACFLGLFSFHKISMYNDLAAHAAVAQAHPIVRALADEADLIPAVPGDLPTDETVDRHVRPEETFQILDADCSQQQAIQTAKRGVSFVLWGPPGTGKSQTIANIIAERIAQGKTVLFVSAKMEALRVVFDRLHKCEIGEFCLEVHSHKANKKAIVDELGRALQATRSSSETADASFEDYLRYRERLNGYAQALHTERTPLCLTAFQVHGKLAALHAAPDLMFRFPGAAGISREERSHLDEALTDLERVGAIAIAPESHEWFGFDVSRYRQNETKADVRSHFTTLAQRLAALEPASADVAERCGVDAPRGLREAERLLALADLLARTPQPPASWFDEGAPAHLIEAACEHAERFGDYRARRAALLERYDEALFALDHGPLISRLDQEHTQLLALVVADGALAADALVLNRTELCTRLRRTSELLAVLAEAAAALADGLGSQPPTTLSDAAALVNLASFVAKDPRPTDEWFSPGRLAQLEGIAAECSDRYSSFLTDRAHLHARFHESVCDLNLDDLFDRFTGRYNSTFRILRPDYHRDRRRLRNELRSPSRLTYDDCVSTLRTGRRLVANRRWIEEHRGAHAQAFGKHFRSLDSDWSGVLASLRAMTEILHAAPPAQVDAQLRPLLLQSGQAVAVVGEQETAVRNALSELESEIGALQRLVSLRGGAFAHTAIHTAGLGELRRWVDYLSGSADDFLAAYDAAAECRRGNENRPVTDVATTLSDLREAAALAAAGHAIRERSADLERDYGDLYTGIDTSWDAVLHALAWTGEVVAWFGSRPTEGFIAAACGERPGVLDIPAMAEPTRGLLAQVNEQIPVIVAMYEQAAPLIGGVPLPGAGLSMLREWLDQHVRLVGDLDDWNEFQTVSVECHRCGLSDFLAAVAQRKPVVSEFKSAFYKRFWALWLDAVCDSDPALRGFDGDRHADIVARFRHVDREQMHVARKRLRDKLYRARPGMRGGQPSGEMSVLLKECGKKSRHKPLRRLFREIPNLILALKPCLLMSPLSVATFLAPTSTFDTLIFDEASQICEEDAVGAIMRGQQAIVVGDSKQLPPTSFFAGGSVGDYDSDDDEDDDDGAATAVYQSVLDSCATIGIPQRMLLWHYRSLCEALIAFSNHHFYGDMLTTFPGPHRVDAASAERCVRWIFVEDGVYVRGKSADARTNRNEAKRVAELVFEQFDSAPQQSLGVIAFSERQQMAIDAEIRRLLRERPGMEGQFADDRHERFFVKNLETVQGDERDVIIFSVGYGKDSAGKLLMNFGPLNKDGGERRLNVAITRARRRVLLVASIEPGDIDLTRTERLGPKLLKHYMEYAIDGPDALAKETDASANAEFGSEFEAQVCAALEDRGLTIHKQVGCSGYRIDLAVVDDARPGAYLLAIECDGRMYRSSKSARDRDRLRAEVLEALGWRIHRIWSSDWVNDREDQIERVMTAVQDARAHREATPDAGAAEDGRARPADTHHAVVSLGPERPQAPRAAVANDGASAALTDTPSANRSGRNSWRDWNGRVPHRASGAPAASPGASRGSPLAGAGSTAPASAGAEVSQPTAAATSDAAKPFQSFRPYAVRRIGTPTDFYDAAALHPGRITDVLIEVVKHEGPVHIEEATRRVVACWGMSKAGKNLLVAVKVAADRARRRGAVTVNGDFLWPAGVTKAAVRIPIDGHPETLRDLEYVAPEEVSSACVHCVEQAFAIDADELIVQVARLFGFQRTGGKVKEWIERGLSHAVQEGRIRRDATGKLHL